MVVVAAALAEFTDHFGFRQTKAPARTVAWREPWGRPARPRMHRSDLPNHRMASVGSLGAGHGLGYDRRTALGVNQGEVAVRRSRLSVSAERHDVGIGNPVAVGGRARSGAGGPAIGLDPFELLEEQTQVGARDRSR